MQRRLSVQYDDVSIAQAALYSVAFFQSYLSNLSTLDFIQLYTVSDDRVSPRYTVDDSIVGLGRIVSDDELVAVPRDDLVALAQPRALALSRMIQIDLCLLASLYPFANEKSSIARIHDIVQIFRIDRVHNLRNGENARHLFRNRHLPVSQRRVRSDHRARRLVRASSHDVAPHLPVFSADSTFYAFHRTPVRSMLGSTRRIVERRRYTEFESLQQLQATRAVQLVRRVQLVVHFYDFRILIRQIVVAQIARRSHERTTRRRKNRKHRDDHAGRMSHLRFHTQKAHVVVGQFAKYRQNAFRRDLYAYFFAVVLVHHVDCVFRAVVLERRLRRLAPRTHRHFCNYFFDLIKVHLRRIAPFFQLQVLR